MQRRTPSHPSITPGDAIHETRIKDCRSISCQRRPAPCVRDRFAFQPLHRSTNGFGRTVSKTRHPRRKRTLNSLEISFSIFVARQGTRASMHDKDRTTLALGRHQTRIQSVFK